MKMCAACLMGGTYIYYSILPEEAANYYVRMITLQTISNARIHMISKFTRNWIISVGIKIA